MSDEKEWYEICRHVASSMREHVLPFCTPISKAITNDYGKHHGTGSYVTRGIDRFLLTNEHVARASSSSQLTHKFWECEDIFRVQSAWVTVSEPIDSAASLVPDAVWQHGVHASDGIPVERFAASHCPVDNELLFFVGFSGDRSNFHFGHLIAAASPYLTREMGLPEDIFQASAAHHFALPYKPDLAVSVDGTSSLPRPPGLSGSLVWDTKRVACLRSDEAWTPSLATVTGMIWGWSSSQGCVLATKVEHLAIEGLLDLAKEHA